MLKQTHRLIILAIVLAIVASSLSGCGGTVAAALRIAAVRALIDEGSDSNNFLVRILADIVSGNALKDAIALITKPDGDEISIVLTLNDAGQYEGTYLASDTDQTTGDQYEVEVTATDTVGNTAVSETVTVDVPITDSTNK